MDIKKIYIDMDGVLADFAGGVRTLCGMEPLPHNAKHRNRAYDDEMWDRIRKCDHFYNRLEPLSGAMEMFDRIYCFYKDRCEILTGIPREERGILQAADDKKEWVHRFLSEDVRINIFNWREKPNYCKGDGYILIDDSKRTIQSWSTAGGIGILHVSAEKTLRDLIGLGVL